ncbi:MAG: hypothetical protein JWN18_602 [Parcubacteria group bacterium]|nr:hypothetical protein [Parcubacteria group bacterium]
MGAVATKHLELKLQIRLVLDELRDEAIVDIPEVTLFAVLAEHVTVEPFRLLHRRQFGRDSFIGESRCFYQPRLLRCHDGYPPLMNRSGV